MVAEKESLITRINYSVRAREIIALGICTPFAMVALTLDRKIIPQVGIGIFQGHALDYFGGLAVPILFRAGASDIVKDRKLNTILGFGIASGVEFT